MPPEVHGYADYVARLEDAVRLLASALQAHRADMHHSSGRPCGTCRASAVALESVGVTPFVDRAGMERRTAMMDANYAHIDGDPRG